MEHTEVSFNNNGTLTTVPKHPLVWVPELSGGKEDDIVVLPNIALLVSSMSF
jgi:CD36 family.